MMQLRGDWICNRLLIGESKIILKTIFFGCISTQIGYNICRTVMLLDVRASLKVVLQMEQGNFPSHKVP